MFLDMGDLWITLEGQNLDKEETYMGNDIHETLLQLFATESSKKQFKDLCDRMKIKITRERADELDFNWKLNKFIRATKRAKITELKQKKNVIYCTIENVNYRQFVYTALLGDKRLGIKGCEEIYDLLINAV